MDLRITYRLRPCILKDADNQRLLNEIGVHHDSGNLLRFLYDPPAGEPTNYAAERTLRCGLIARKVSRCSKNGRGAEAYAAYKIIIRTLLKKGADVVEELTRLLCSSSSPPDTS